MKIPAGQVEFGARLQREALDVVSILSRLLEESKGALALPPGNRGWGPGWPPTVWPYEGQVTYPELKCTLSEVAHLLPPFPLLGVTWYLAYPGWLSSVRHPSLAPKGT